jgi:Ca2+/H+ antiporter, TMEM165/GDT1 family
LIGDAARAFITIFPAELPDKTMVASIVLVARYKHPWAVWVGVATAFTVHVTVAVAAGRLVSLLPDRAVKGVVLVLFSMGAVILWRAATGTDDEAGLEGEVIARASTRTAIAGSFGVIVLAEWGDLTQLATASLAATSETPLAVGVGALLALWAVAGIAVTAGRQLIKRVPLAVVHRVAAVIFAGLAVLTLYELIRG